MIKNTFAFLTIAISTFTCSEVSENDRPQVPWPGEWIPIYYTMGTDKTEHSIQDCKDNIESFSKELNEFMSGNLVIGEGLDRLGQSVTEFRGTYTWVSRCDVNYQYSGIWNTPDAGAIITYESEALPDSTLQFKCATSPSSGTWKFHYEKGGETLIINYDLKRN